MKSTLMALVVAVASATSAFASTLTLPAPTGSSVVAGWVPTNAAVVSGTLEYTGVWPANWTGVTNVAPSVTNGSGTWTLTTGGLTGANFGGTESLYIFNSDASKRVINIATTDYSGPALGKISLQLAINRDLTNFAPTLTIGSTTFDVSDAATFQDATFFGNVSDPTNRYSGHFGDGFLLTYEWDLSGYTGSFSDISFNWGNPDHTSIYDIQINAQAVPEPSTVAFLASAGLLAGLRFLRRRHLAAAALSLGFAFAATPVQAVIVEPGFQSANPSVDSGGQLSGFGAIAPIFGAIDAANVGFIGWEKFNSGNFSEFGHQYSGNSGSLSGTIDQNSEDVGLSTAASNTGYGSIGGSDYYGRLVAGAGQSYDFAIAAISTLDITRVSLAIKHSPFLDEVDGDPLIAFSATLNGIASNAPVLGMTANNFSDPLVGMPMNTLFYVYSWDINILAGESFVLNFTSLPEMLGLGFSVDSIGLAVHTVPEPSSIALLAGGAGMAAFLRYRKSKHKS